MSSLPRFRRDELDSALRELLAARDWTVRAVLAKGDHG
jgi:hypothetical protein